MWGNHFTALIAPAAINQWLSGFFNRDVQLRWLGPQLTRRVKRHDAVPLSFADGYPYLLANEASLRDLQQRCPASVSIEQFRLIWWSPVPRRGMKIAGKLFASAKWYLTSPNPAAAAFSPPSARAWAKASVRRAAGDVKAFSYRAG